MVQIFKKLMAIGLPAALLVYAVSAETAELVLSYRIYTGGYNAATVSVKLDLAQDHYRVTTNLATNGFADLLLRFVQMSESRGEIGAERWYPKSFKSHSDGRFGQRIVEMEYGEDRSTITALDPPQAEDDRDIVPEAMTVATYDPITAVTSAIRGDNERPCIGKVPVFDGRRRYNLSFQARDIETLEVSDLGGYQGLALLCEIVFEPVAGFARQYEAETRTLRPPTKLWLVDLGDDTRWIPVRLLSESTFGRVITHLVRVTDGDTILYKSGAP